MDIWGFVMRNTQWACSVPLFFFFSWLVAVQAQPSDEYVLNPVPRLILYKSSLTCKCRLHIRLNSTIGDRHGRTYTKEWFGVHVSRLPHYKYIKSRGNRMKQRWKNKKTLTTIQNIGRQFYTKYAPTSHFL